MLGKSLEDFTFTNLESSQSSSMYGSSFCDVYSIGSEKEEMEIGK
jgi:hypothetical protein